ncbi:MAG: M14 family zinc carboxypeptidase [Gemmatimonadota bacterium]
MIRRIVVPVALFALFAAGPLAAQGFDFYTRGPYRASVPRPDTLLGYRLGSQHTMYHQQQAVLDRLVAGNPERVRTEVIGTTVEGKVMRLLIISAPENLARLDRIRADLARLADPRATGPAEARAIADRLPAVVLLTHSVHGNEPAGFEAAMQIAYQLLASDEPATLEILRNLVVLVNPSQNPDGHERFAAWYNSVAVGTDEPAALEHHEPWSVQGRFNHYRFDLNRDMLAQSQNESRALAATLARWRPQVVADLHSTVAQYFFPPNAEAINKNYPASTGRWLETFGRNNGAAFDAYGWQYYVRDVFDAFYPGYIDGWPSFHGAIGMTFETDGGPELKVRKDDGTYITFEMGIAHHYVAAMATLATAAANRAALLADYYAFHESGLAEAKGRAMKRVVFSPDPDPARALWLARLLAREGVEVTRTTRPFTALKATSYLGGPAVKREFPAGSYVVDLVQPEARFATAILEPRAVFDSNFVQAQLARYDRNKLRGEAADREPYDFYDITAWSLPLTLGLEAWWTEDTAPVTGHRVTPDDSLPGAGVPGRAQSAYVFTNATEAGAKLAMHLAREGYKVAVATRPLRADGVSYPRGTFVVRLQRNPETVHAAVARLAQRFGVAVVPVRSAYPDSGQVGVGSETVVAVNVPRILLAGGDGIDQTAFGATWHYLERELEYGPVTVTLASLSRIDLSQYNVLIVPAGSPARMWRELGETGAARLKAWVQDGGAILTWGDAAGLFARKELGLTTVRAVGQDDDEEKKDRKEVPRDTTVAPTALPAPPLVSPTATAGTKPEFVPGAIFRATLDRTHWLTFGYERDQLPVMLGSAMLKPSEKGDNPVAFVGSDLTLAGFTWPDNTEKFLRGSVWAAVERSGRGRVVILAEDPLFRGFWRGTARLVTNTLLFATGR